MLLQHGNNRLSQQLCGELLVKGPNLFLLRIAQGIPFFFVPGVSEEGTETDVGSAALSEAFSVLLMEVDVSLPFTAIIHFVPDFCGCAGTAAGEVLSCNDSFFFQRCEGTVEVGVLLHFGGNAQLSSKGTTTLDELFYVVLYALFPELAVFVFAVVFQPEYVHHIIGDGFYVLFGIRFTHEQQGPDGPEQFGFVFFVQSPFFGEGRVEALFAPAFVDALLISHDDAPLLALYSLSRDVDCSCC